MIKAITILNELQDLNYGFLANNRNGFKINNKSFIYKEGKIPILFSAPHAVRQVREGQIKASDYLTGPLAIYLANRCNASYFVRVFNDGEDPNYPLERTLQVVQSAYLLALKEFIREYNQFLVIDLHGAGDNHNYDLSFWHDNYNACSENIINLFMGRFLERGFLLDDGSEFLGGQVTRQCASLAFAFQLEIKRKIRTLNDESFPLLNSFLDGMEESTFMAYDYARKLERK